MDRLMMKHTVRRALLLACAPLLLGGCPLFRDPAAPPFADRIEAVQSLTEYGVVPALRDRPEMRVINTGVREFLLLDAPVEDGRLLLVLNSDLSLADTSFDVGGIREAFPIGYDAGFVVGSQRFNADGEFLDVPVNIFAGDTFRSDDAAIGNELQILRLSVDPGNSTLDIGPSYTAGDDYSIPSTAEVNFPVRFVTVEDGDPPGPEPGFRLLGFSNLPQANENNSSVGLLIENDGDVWAGTLSFSNVSQLYSTPAGDTPTLTIGANEYEDLVSVPGFVRIRQLPRTENLTFTSSGVVRLGFEHHEIYSRESGERIARRSVPREEYISYAYSPTGRHLYMLDTIRWRVYRVSRWW